MSSTYCNEPWRTVHYDEQGRLGPCCTFRGQRSLDTTVEEYWNGTWLRDFRTSLLNGERPRGCRNCWAKEDRGESSQRTEKNKKHGYVSEANIHELFLSFGNICNKTCNICRPQRSHLIAKEYRQIPQDNEWLQEKIKQQPKVMGSLDKDFSGRYLSRIEDYFTALQSADVIHLDGGEPFIVSQCDEILDYMISNNMTDKHIKATTNGSVNRSQLDKLAQFRQVSFHLSIDGVDGLYELVRPPHDWQWWCKQHNQIREYDFHITYATVAHAFNVHQLPEILEYMIANSRTHGNTNAYISQLNNQEYLGCDVVPESVVYKTVWKLERMDIPAHMQNNVKNIINHLNKAASINNDSNKKYFDLYMETFGPIKKILYSNYIPWITND